MARGVYWVWEDGHRFWFSVFCDGYGRVFRFNSVQEYDEDWLRGHHFLGPVAPPSAPAERI